MVNVIMSETLICLVKKLVRSSWCMDAGIGLISKKLVGEPKQLTFGHATNARWAEGPHLYKIKGKYVLLLAEGGNRYLSCRNLFC